MQRLAYVMLTCFAVLREEQAAASETRLPLEWEVNVAWILPNITVPDPENQGPELGKNFFGLHQLHQCIVRQGEPFLSLPGKNYQLPF